MSLTPYLGQAFLSLALLASCLQSFWRFSSSKRAYQMAKVQCVFVVGAFIILTFAHVTSDFSVVNVVANSHTAKPLLYKIGGVWGNHEGSMLLWVMILSLYGVMVKRVSIVPLMGVISAGFLLFMLIACNPFEVMASIPQNGDDLNPLLQDPSLVIHPPFLYSGYVGFSIPFCLAIDALIKGKLDIDWVRETHFWTMVSWSFLTFGLLLGSFWAYYELGWGGWWFWDPVENAALMPWLMATALLHSLKVTQNKNAFNAWSLFLAILTFSLCLLGMFLVRSGLLISVHSFAIDPERGVILFFLCCLIILPALILFCMRIKNIRSLVATSPLSRSGFLLFNNIFLLCGTSTILLAIFYPLILGFFNQSISIGAPYFQATFVPLMVPLLFLVGLGPWFSWAENSLHDVVQKILPAFCLTASLILGGYYFTDHPASFLAIIGNAGALWVIIATAHLYIKTNKKSLSFYSMCLAHVGLGIAVLGMIESTVGEIEIMPTLASNESVVVGQYNVTLEKIEIVKGPNYNAQKAHLLLTKNGKDIATLQPEKRFYWTQKNIHSETAIYSNLVSHVYVAMGEEYTNGQWSFRFYFKPWINLLWFGVVLIAVGGALSAWNKRKALFFILLLMLGGSSFATNAHELLNDPHLEAVARELDKTILCPVCSGQTLDSSMADMA